MSTTTGTEMRVVLEQPDSEMWGRDVLTVKGHVVPQDWPSFEHGFRQEHNPGCVFCRVPAEDVAAVHFLEDNGFHLIECQMDVLAKVKHHDVSRYVQYQCAEVTDDDALQQVLAIAGTTFTHDRYSRDPAFGKSFSGERYRRFVLQSHARADEHVLGLSEVATHRIVGFMTYREETRGRVHALLGGIRTDLKLTGAGFINELFWINMLEERGVREFWGSVSCANYPIVNMEIRALGFRVVQSWIVLRKIYPTVSNARG